MNYQNTESNSYFRREFEQMREISYKPQSVASKSIKSILEDLLKFGLSNEVVENLKKIHKRKFSPEPIGYPKPSDITKLLLHGSFTFPDLTFDSAQLGNIFTMDGLNKNSEYPWYWVAEDLAFDLVKTTPPNEIPNRIALPNMGVLILPSGTLVTSTGEVTSIFYRLLKPGENPTFNTVDSNKNKGTISIPFKGQESYKLAWVAPELSGYIYGGVLALISDSNINSLRVDIEENFFAWEDLEKEKADTDRCLSLLLSILVYANQNESQVSNEVPKPIGIGKRKNDLKNNLLRPIFIGNEYKSLIRQAGHGTHASPKIHWRRGHWKTVAVGEGRRDREWRFISPTLVMGDSQSRTS